MRRHGTINETLIFTLPIAIILGFAAGIANATGHPILLRCIIGISFLIVVGFPLWNLFLIRRLKNGVAEFFDKEFTEITAIQTSDEAKQYLEKKSQSLKGGIQEAKLYAYWTTNRLPNEERQRLQKLLDIEEDFGQKYFNSLPAISK